MTGTFICDENDADAIAIIESYPANLGQITLDNKVINEIEKEFPDDSWVKADIKDWMDDEKIPYNSGDTKSDLIEKISHN